MTAARCPHGPVDVRRGREYSAEHMPDVSGIGDEGRSLDEEE
jgi:hypothetical protein